MLTKTVMDSLYQVYPFLNKATRLKLGLMRKIPVFVKEPLVTMKNLTLGVQEIEVR